jgi:hypothetical protein
MEGDGSPVWVFHGSGSPLALGVLSSKVKAEKWIQENRLSGTLASYLLDIPIYDWALRSGVFRPHQPHHGSPEDIQNLGSASQEHYLYELGTRNIP